MTVVIIDSDVKLGDAVRDTLTGFEGIASGFTCYLTGCDQVLVTPPSKEGKVSESGWFDVARMAVTQEEAYLLPELEVSATVELQPGGIVPALPKPGRQRKSRQGAMDPAPIK